MKHAHHVMGNSLASIVGPCDSRLVPAGDPAALDALGTDPQLTITPLTYDFDWLPTKQVLECVPHDVSPVCDRTA